MTTGFLSLCLMVLSFATMKQPVGSHDDLGSFALAVLAVGALLYATRNRRVETGWILVGLVLAIVLVLIPLIAVGAGSEP